MTFPWSCPHFTFEDFNLLQAFVSDSFHSLRDVVSKEFQPGSQLSQYDPEKPIDYHGYCLFMMAYLGENFPQSIRDKLFLSFMRRNSYPEIMETNTTTDQQQQQHTQGVSSEEEPPGGPTVIGQQPAASPKVVRPEIFALRSIDSNNEQSPSKIPHLPISSTMPSSQNFRSTRIHSLTPACTSNLFYGITEKLNALGLGSVIPNPPRSAHPPIHHHHHHPYGGGGFFHPPSSNKYKTLPLSIDHPLFGKFQGKKGKSALGAAHSHPSLYSQSVNNNNTTTVPFSDNYSIHQCHDDNSPALHSRSSSKKSATTKKLDTDIDLVLKQHRKTLQTSTSISSNNPNHHHHHHHPPQTQAPPTHHHHHNHNNNNNNNIRNNRLHSTINLCETDKIDMKDLLCYLSLLESGRPEDKLEFMFRLYDTDGNGVLDNSEVESIISQMMNVAAYLNWDTEELLPIIQEMMHEIDYDNDGEVTLEEWKRGGMTNIPLLVLLGLDTNVRDDGKHVWSQKHFSKVNHCGVCNKILVRFGRQGLCCIFCKFTVHERCVAKSPNSCISTYSKSRKADQTMEHHWLTNHYSAKCAKCRKSTKACSSTINKTGVHCRWCKRTVHRVCADSMSIICDLGDNKEHILPPSSIFPSVLERKATPKSKDTSVSEDGNDGKTIEDDQVDNTDIANTFTNQTCHQQPPQQTSSFQIFAAPGTKPLLVFVNPKSGGKQGARILEKFNFILNPRQVYDLVRDKGPHKGLQFFKDVPEFRILVCGGDGTVGWLLEAMDKYEWTSNRPCVSILPLGTGNDLARCLKWGGGYDGENLDKILSRLSIGYQVLLDRWQITCSEPAPRPVHQVSNVTRRESKNSSSGASCTTTAGGGGGGNTKMMLSPSGGSVSKKQQQSPPPPPACTTISLNDGSSSQFDSGIREDSQYDYYDEIGELESDVLSEDMLHGEEMPCNIINNYFSIGVDASIAHRFHTLREKHPEKFNSRMRNRMFYMEVGTSEVLTATCKHLHEYVDIICDGVALDLRRRGALEGIAFLNIPSVYGGKNLWGCSSGFQNKKNSNSGGCDEDNIGNTSRSSRFSMGSKKKKNDTSCNNREALFNEKLANAVQDMGDNLLEVVGLENAMHAGLVAGGFRSSGIRLAQCKEVVIRTQRCFPMQIDGEPWIQSACTISITYKNQVPMIMAPTMKKFGLKGMFSR